MFALLFKQMIALAMPDSHKLQEHWIQLCKYYIEGRETGLKAEEVVKNKIAEAMLLSADAVSAKLDKLA